MSRRKSRPEEPLSTSTDPKPARKAGLLDWVRARFFAGIVIAAPIAITIIVTVWLIGVIDEHVKPLIPPAWNPETYTAFAIPGLGVLVVAVGLFLLGALGTNLIGRFFIQTGERIMGSVPYVSSFYKTLRQITDTVANQGSNSFKEVCMVEYPKTGTWCIGFLAGDARGEIAHTLGPDMVAVFVPTTPNPTSGFLMYIHVSEIRRLSMSIEDGAKLIISGGLVVPSETPEPPSPPQT
jgi:uncharacterized membrane protein